MYTLMVRGKFDSAHFLPNYDGKCKETHGHTWHVKAAFRYEKLDSEQGFAKDFRELKGVLNTILDLFDHKTINDILTSTPTAEKLAEVIYKEIAEITPDIVWVDVWETEDSGVRYEPTRYESRSENTTYTPTDGMIG